MEALTAAVVLAWLLIVLLAFALAGILHQVRHLRGHVVRLLATTTRSATGADPQLAAEVLPRSGRSFTAILLVDESCPICAEVAPCFLELGTAREASATDFVLLSRDESTKFAGSGDVRYVKDSGTFHQLDPGWRPALVVIDRKGKVLAAEPAGSPKALSALLMNMPFTAARGRG